MKTILDILLQKNIIKNYHIEQIKSYRDYSPIPIEEILQTLEIATEDEIVKVLYEYMREYYKSSVSVSDFKTDTKMIQKIKYFNYLFKKSVSEEKKQIILSVDEGKKTVHIGCANILDTFTLNETKEYYLVNGYKCEFYAISYMLLALQQKRIYTNVEEFKENMKQKIKSEKFNDQLEEFRSMLIEYSILERASDIFFPLNEYENFNDIFLRIDREKVFLIKLPVDKMKSLIQRLKMKCKMEIARVGHADGQLKLKILDGKYTVNIRANSIRETKGEQLTFRLQNGQIEKLDRLGFNPTHVSQIREKLKSKKGIVVLSGVTGSGKSTTIRAMIREFDPNRFNIITLEDPVEVEIRGVHHISTNDKIKGQSFDEGIRACMRQAPDIIFIGEIRDDITRSRAVKARTTGHLVFTTIHANSTRGIKERLEYLKVDKRDLFMENISVALHQELVKEEGVEGLNLCYEFMLGGKQIFSNIK